MMMTASMLRLLSETNAIDVMGLTSWFGMEQGITPLLWPSSIFRVLKTF